MPITLRTKPPSSIYLLCFPKRTFSANCLFKDRHHVLITHHLPCHKTETGVAFKLSYHDGLSDDFSL
jgi:hypothetical protein